ncbi:hypothetical protein [Rubritalea sp.]|uniref:hypothetical protein n=1 Tax=Rubritalea sp. TaxID=2109375 RepID=UPI003EFAF643
MYELPKLHIHKDALSNLPASGQRRDLLLKKLRAIQVSPASSSDFDWQQLDSNSEVRVSICVGYAISWFFEGRKIYILDIRGQ